MPNKFTLRGRDLEIDYLVGITHGLAALTYKAGGSSRGFPASAVATASVPYGSFVTVTLVQELGAVGETFSVLLPALQDSDAPVAFKTIGIHAHLRGPAIVEGEVPTYAVVHLDGVAETAILPLDQGQPAAATA
jgi:hypothetical protein